MQARQLIKIKLTINNSQNRKAMMYQYYNIKDMAMCAEKAVTERMRFPEQVMIYVGGDPDVSGPSFVIDWLDHDGLELFRNFCRQMADHYKSLSEANANGPISVE